MSFDAAKNIRRAMMVAKPRIDARQGLDSGGEAKQAREVGDSNVRKGTIVYHGSPHKFDKFDASKIGTGEGAQAYGHGMYFAENEGVAKSYRDALAGNDLHVAGNKVPGDHPLSFVRRYLATMGGKSGVLDKDTADYIRENELRRKNTNQGPGLTRAQHAALRSSEGQPYEFKPGGSMYKARINADPEEFLDWDKPLGQQHPKVQGAIKAIDPDVGSLMRRKNYTAGNYAENMKSARGPKWLPDQLQQAGIPGIRYLDQASRGSADGSGTSNYVAFNPDSVHVLDRYKQGGSVDQALNVARKHRDSGGSAALSRAIKQFSKARASQWDPQGTALRAASWDPQGVGMAKSRELMLSDAPQPPQRPKSTLGDLSGDAKQGDDLYDTIGNGARALGLAPAKKDTAGSTGVGHVDLAGGSESGSAPPTFSGDARKVAENYLGRPMSDTEYDWLRRATVAESGGDPKEDAMVTASILNRARGLPGDSVIAVLKAPNQFQSVTGTAYNNHAPSSVFTKPDLGRLSQVETNMGAYLPNISNDQKNFTAGSDAAYGPGTTKKYRDDMLANGGVRVGASVFNTPFPGSGQPAPVQAAGPGVPTSPAAAIARGPSPTAPQDAGQLVPSAVSGAPKGHLRIADPEGLHTYPGPNETSAPQPGSPAATPNPTDGYGSAPSRDTAPAIAAPPPAVIPAPSDKGIPDAPFHTASLGPEGDSAPPPAAQQQDTLPPPDQPPHDLYGDIDMPDVMLPARRGGSIAKAMKLARKHRASGGGSSNPGITDNGVMHSQTITPTALMGDSSFPSGGGPISDQQMMELLSFSLDTPIPDTSTSPAAPQQQQDTLPPPPIENNTVGNSFSILGTQGKPSSGPYNNTLDEVLGTNNPTGQDVFGFEYPNVPPPQPNPYVGPVSTMSGTYNPGSGGSGAGGSSMSGYQGSVGATPTGAAPTLLSPAPVNYPGSNLSYLPPMVGGGHTNNAPSSTLGAVPGAVPRQTPGGNAYLGVKRGGAVKRALKVARSR